MTDEQKKPKSEKGEHGGKRDGSGRKKTREKFETEVNKAEKKIANKLPWLVDRMLELAGGVKCADYDLEGNPNVYDKAPDRQAIEYLLNRILGKPTEHQEIEGGETTKVEINIAPQDVNYRTATSALAPRPVGDSQPSGQDQSVGDGAPVG